MERYLAGLIYDDRSGSTYLASKLAPVPYVSVTVESRILTTLARLGDVVDSRREVAQIVNLLWEEGKFRTWGANKEFLISTLEGLAYPIKMEEFLFGLLDAVFSNKKAEVTKVYVIKQVSIMSLEDITRIFPSMKFLLIYRDGRAVFASKKKAAHSVFKVPMEIDPKRAAEKWQMILKRATAVVPPARLLRVCYEELLKDEVAVMRKVINFICNGSLCDSAWRKINMERVTLSSTYFDQIPEDQKHLHENVGHAPKLERIEGWKTELADIEIWIYETRARESLIKYHYPLSKIRKPNLLRRLVFSARTNLAEAQRKSIIFFVKTKKWLQSPHTAILAASTLIQIKRK